MKYLYKSVMKMLFPLMILGLFILSSCGDSTDNKSPFVTITSPVSGDTFASKSDITVSAVAGDSDGHVTMVEFFNGSTSLGVASSYPFTITWTSVPDGNYTLSATATDNEGATRTSSSVSVSVGDPDPGTPTVTLSAPQNGAVFQDGDQVTLTADVTANGAVISGVEFFDDAVSVGRDTSLPYSMVWQASQQGKHTLKAVVTTNGGVTATSANISITVNDPGTPAVTLSSPQNGAVFQDGDQVTLTADVTANGAVISGVEFFVDSVSVGDDSSSPYSLSWQASQQGQHTLKAVVTTTGGVTATSADISITVNVPGTPSVTLSSPQNGAVFQDGDQVTLAADVTANGSVISGVEFFVDGTSVGDDSTSPYSLSWMATQEGRHTLKAVVTTAGGTTASSADVSICVGSCDDPDPDESKKIVVGYWHNWNHSAAPYIGLTDVPDYYDVICIAFAEPVSHSDMTLVFNPCAETGSAAQFKSDVKAVQATGKKVLISIGGANAHIALETEQDKDNFVSSLKGIIDEYGFDGLDVDLEGTSLLLGSNDTDFKNPVAPRIVNFISGVQEICSAYSSDFMLTAAPETAHVQGAYSAYSGVFGSYLPFLYAMKDRMTYIHVQHYNTGSMYGIDGNIYTPATADFHVAMTEMLLQGFPVAYSQTNIFPAFKPEQVAFGLPMATQAAGSGFTAEAEVKKALDYLITGVSFGGSYQLKESKGYCNLKGVMGWSINWDGTRNHAFGKFYTSLLNSYPECTDTDNGGSGKDELKCTYATQSEVGGKFTAIRIAENANSEYAWNGTCFAVKSIEFETTSTIESASSDGGTINVTSENGKVFLDLGWQSLFPYQQKVEITLTGSKDGETPFPVDFKTNYVRANDILYPKYTDLPDQWQKGNEALTEADLIDDAADYYRAEATPSSSTFIVYEPTHKTQVNIGQVMSMDYPVNTVANVRIWMPTRLMAMGLAFTYEMFKINPHYMCALGTKENFSAGVVPPEAGNLNNPVQIDGQTWYWPIVTHPDGPFQQETGNFNDCKSFFPDLLANTNHDDLLSITADRENPNFITAAISSGISLTVTREQLHAVDKKGFREFIETATDPYAEFSCLTFAYNRGFSNFMAKKS